MKYASSPFELIIKKPNSWAIKRGRKMSFTKTAIAAAMLTASMSSHALLIDFEMDAAGGTPVDNAAIGLGDMWTDGTTSVSVGFATAGSTTRTIEARFEFVGDTDGGDFGYFNGGSGGLKDTPNTPGAMGDWFLRSNGFPADTTQAFVIDYAGMGTDGLSAEIWDIDGRTNGDFESWTVDAYGVSGLLASIDSPVGTDGEGTPLSNLDGVLNGRPWEFGFSSAALGEKITKVVINYTGTAGNVGLAFDNFNADANLLVTVPEPTTVAPMGLGLAGMGWRRKKAS